MNCTFTAAGQHKLLQHVFRRHLKPKKQHEVARLSLVAGYVARTTCDGVMVDVGSGQGHLSRLLAYGHDVRVVCLEAQDEFIRGAKWVILYAYLRNLNCIYVKYIFCDLIILVITLL